MTIETLDSALHMLRRAQVPADVFGACFARPAALKRRYRELVALVHPDHNPRRAADAHEAFRRLQQWYAIAQRSTEYVASGTTVYISATTALHTYHGMLPPIHGDLCDLFPADAAGTPVLLKVARSPRNHDLLEAEANALQRFAREFNSEPVRAHFPTLLERFTLVDDAGTKRQVNVLHAEASYVSLADVFRAYPSGIHPADAAWMFNRMLAALGSTHALGLVYGALVPAHVLVRPDDHNGMLIDWCYCVPIGQPLRAISPAYAAEYPPEVQGRLPATPATDVFMVARAMTRLLGGDPARNTFPSRVPKAMAALLRSCMIPAPQRRASDAWQVFDDFREILAQCYGAPVFRPFHMPATVAAV